MKIVIDGRMYQESGVGRYIRNLISYLQKLDKSNNYYILHLKSDYDNLSYSRNFHKVLANFKWYGVSEQVKLPRLLQSLLPDLVHFPHFNVPFFYRGKFVVTIHDLIHQHYQMRRATTLDPFLYKIKQFGYRGIFKVAINESKKIFVPSEYVRGLLVNEWRVKGEKIVVTPEGVDDKLISIARKISQSKKTMILKKFNIKPPFLFYVGNAHSHKNIEGLIKTFLKLKDSGLRQNDKSGLKLVLSGKDNYFWQKVKNEYGGRDIIFTGFISDEELVALYKKAQVFVMPSFEEGFGLPILEAFAAGCPVVSSNAASLPEVGGDAAIYFDLASPDDMVEKISQVLNSPSHPCHPESRNGVRGKLREGSNNLRTQLIEKGLVRYKLFSWEKLAKQTLEVYEKSLV